MTLYALLNQFLVLALQYLSLFIDLIFCQIQFGKITSTKKLTKYIDNFNFERFVCGFENVYILLDSKGKYLKSVLHPTLSKFQTTLNTNLHFFTYPGLNTTQEFLQFTNFLATNQTAHQTNSKILFWFGSCDVTSMNKATRELAINEPLGDVADSMVTLFNEVTRILKDHSLVPESFKCSPNT